MLTTDRVTFVRNAGFTSSVDLAHLRVLVIDDDAEDAELTQRALSEIPWFTCAVDSANTYADALVALRTNEYDVILLDQGLGARSGLELLEEAFGATLPVAVVLLTGMASHQVDEAASRAGIAHLLEKSELRAGPLERSVRYALERTRIERELRSARAFFRAAFDALSDHVAILDDQGRIVETNRAWQVFAQENGFLDAMAGRGRNYLEVCNVAADGGDPVAAAVGDGLRAMLGGDCERFGIMYPCNAPGAERWFNLDATVVRLDGARRVMVAHQNVTERLRIEGALRDSAESLRLLFNSNPTPLWVVDDATGRLVSANDAAIAQYGYSREAFLTMTAHDLLPPQERESTGEFLATRRAGVTTMDVERLRTKGGAVIEVEIILRAIEYGGRASHMVLATDVTDRKHAERASADALAATDLERRRLQALLDIMPVGVFITDASGQVTHANAEAHRIWADGLPAGGPVNTARYRAFFADTGRELAPDEWASSLARRTGALALNQELEIARLDGTRGHVLNSAAPIRDADGSITGTVIVNVDITERYEEDAERARLVETLEFERNRLSGIFREAPAFMAVVRGKDHVFEMVNDAYVALMGRDPTGRAGAEALPEAAEQGFIALADTVFATGEAYVGTQAPLVVRADDGAERKRVVNFVFQPLWEADGSVSGILIHGVDVTAQSEAVAAVRQSEAQFRSLVELSPDGILIHLGGTIVFASRSAARILSAESPAGLIGWRMIDLVHPEEKAHGEARLAQLAAGKAVPPAEIRWLTMDGSTRYMNVSSMSFDFNGRPAVQTVFRDVTAHRQLEEQLRQAQKMEAVGQLAGGVAHDFNNLLTIIKANAEFLLEDLASGSPHRAGLIEVNEAANRAAALTRQLLAFSRKQILQARVLDFNAVVTNVQPMLSRLIREDVVVDVQLTEDLGHILADAGQLEQVLLNLALNARDAMPGGGRLRVRTAEVALTHEARMEDHAPVLPGRYAMLLVSDTGSGIPADVRARIFEPFFTTKSIGYGTGLGLATVYGIVKQSGGYLQVESEPGAGTTFRVYFPIVPDDITGIGEGVVARETRGPETILLVEDMDPLREIARRVLAGKGYTVLQAHNGKEAMELAARHAGPIDLLLTDVVMPEMNGVQLVEALVRTRPSLSVLFMSGYAEDEAMRHRVETARARFVPKPFSPASLLQQVREALDAKR